MAKKETVITTIIDDMTNEELTEDQATELIFGWEGARYRLDISKLGAAKFEKFITPYVEAAEKISATRGRPRSTGGSSRKSSGSGLSKEELAAARAWLKQNGHEVNDRGRIKGELLELYTTAHTASS